MQRIALVNMIFGFSAIILASLGGFFLATDADKAFLMNKELLQSWQYTLFKSAHGHLNLFGILHILIGLTMPYSKLPLRLLNMQSLGLMIGTLCMGFLLIFRGYLGISEGLDILGITIGICLSIALLALIVHCSGLIMKLFQRA